MPTSGPVNSTSTGFPGRWTRQLPGKISQLDRISDNKKGLRRESFFITCYLIAEVNRPVPAVSAAGQMMAGYANPGELGF
ncbi:MAG: hypothetical protein JWP00_2630 [Chloroflexi bacterium]|jgi:hypothetical protein|nr:hypothetical protein [Chloroflexota bacterium]